MPKLATLSCTAPSPDDVRLLQAVSLARDLAKTSGVVHGARTAAIRFDVPFSRCIVLAQRALEACAAAKLVKLDVDA